MHKTVMFMFFVLLSMGCYPQKAYSRYSIDIKQPQKRNVPIGFLIQQSKQKLSENINSQKKLSKQKQIARKQQKRAYAIQTNIVQKQMKLSKKEAQRYNNNYIPVCVKIKHVITDIWKI